MNNHTYRTLSILSLLGGFIFTSSMVFAFPGRETQIPNNQWTCGICHVNPAGAGTRTTFGEDIKSFGTEGGNVNWAGVCDRDSDGDSFTNGEELGDPSCTWVFGDPNPAAEVTNPIDAESFPETMAEGGEMMAEGGEMMAEGGEMMAEGGEMMAEGGEMMAEGDEVAEEEESGCSTHNRSPTSLLFFAFGLFALTRIRRSIA
jgi:hypothetical protein